MFPFRPCKRALTDVKHKAMDECFRADKGARTAWFVREKYLLCTCICHVRHVYTGFIIHIHLLYFNVNSFTEKQQHCFSTFYYSELLGFYQSLETRRTKTRRPSWLVGTIACNIIFFCAYQHGRRDVTANPAILQ